MTSILTGIPRASINSTGGLRKVLFAIKTDVQPVMTAGVVTFETGALADFKEYIPTKESSNCTETYTGTPTTGQGVVAQVLTMLFHKSEASKRTELQMMAQNELVAIVIDKNGFNKVLGITNGLDITSNVGTTGTAGGDLNGYTVTFTGNEPEIAGSVADSFFTEV